MKKEREKKKIKKKKIIFFVNLELIKIFNYILIYFFRRRSFSMNGMP
jgi:hypothetical protein